ncbi:hypothetical protein SAMN05421676_1073 [Salinibacillus kushneri]|uniref:Uncharacterized protein n=1 Tax=Salinibacillus kushneri TaxID=237682 RepID=A0A1I0GH83_9BACI|nr:hypothetical protein [Salinibacillus kushneri]SET70506.1 hypothetical protein SAMN05421676_1073 [Salinibacillus kushneri]
MDWFIGHTTIMTGFLLAIRWHPFSINDGMAGQGVWVEVICKTNESVIIKKYITY